MQGEDATCLTIAKKKPVTAEDLKHPYYCIFHPPTQFQSQNIRFGVPFHLRLYQKLKFIHLVVHLVMAPNSGFGCCALSHPLGIKALRESYRFCPPLVTMSSSPVNFRSVKYLFSHIAQSYAPQFSHSPRRALLFYVK